MKKDIHPKYKKLKIKIGKDEFLTRSTLRSDELLMDVDFRKHPAWNKGSVNLVNRSNQNINNFNKRFGNFLFGIKK